MLQILEKIEIKLVYFTQNSWQLSQMDLDMMLYWPVRFEDLNFFWSIYWCYVFILIGLIVVYLPAYSGLYVQGGWKIQL